MDERKMIYLDDAIRIVERFYKVNEDIRRNMAFELRQLPYTQSERKKGEWITNSHGFPPEPTSVCSECGFDRDFYIRIRGFDKIKYCPNCGTKMN